MNLYDTEDTKLARMVDACEPRTMARQLRDTEAENRQLRTSRGFWRFGFFVLFAVLVGIGLAWAVRRMG